MKGVKIKFIEVPSGINFQDQARLLNVWINDMQRNGIKILSTNFEQREELNGELTIGFLIEYTDELEEVMVNDA